MKKTLIGILAIAAFFACAGMALALGETATDFTLKDAKGADFRLGDHLGKEVIVMSFWMSWCKPCMVEMPMLDQLYKKHKAKGFTVVSVNADDSSGLALAKTIVRQKGVSFPVVFDASTEVTGIYNPNKQFPYTILIGKDKKIAFVKAGFTAGDEKLLEEQINKALAASGQ